MNNKAARLSSYLPIASALPGQNSAKRRLVQRNVERHWLVPANFFRPPVLEPTFRRVRCGFSVEIGAMRGQHAKMSVILVWTSFLAFSVVPAAGKPVVSQHSLCVKSDLV